MNYHQPEQTQLAARSPAWWRIGRYAAGAVLLALVLGVYWQHTHQAGEGGAARPRNLVPPVRVSTAAQRDMAIVEHTIGTVVANSTVTVTARVQGQLLRANFKEGQIVKQGDLLFEIDPRPYKAVYDNAFATLTSAKAKAERYGRLLKQSAIAAQDAEDAQAAYLEAVANTEAAQLNLEFTKIRSPINGKTGPIMLQPGNLVQGTNNNGTGGQPIQLVTITQFQPIKVSFSLPQSELPRIQAQAQAGALTAHVSLRDEGGVDVAAPVDFVSNMVGNTSGTIELRATVPNGDSALVPGQLVNVSVSLANLKGAVVVPREAVNSAPSSQFVYVVNADHRAEQHTVKVLFDDGASMAIASDVRPGDKVITDGQLRVLTGGRVSIIGGKALKH